MSLARCVYTYPHPAHRDSIVDCPGVPFTAVAPSADAVQQMLDAATRAFADAGTSSERVEVISDLLASWYAAWPASAVTDEHEGIAHQLVALVYAAEARAAPPVDGRSRQVADSILANARADADRAHRMHDEASDEVDRLNAEHRLLRRHLTALADSTTARASETEAPADGLALAAVAASIRMLVNHRANAASCPCTPAAPVHLHGIGGYSTEEREPQHKSNQAAATELPGWVLELVRGLDRYELEHPTLYRQNGDGTYSRWPCPEPLLALVPAEVRRRAERAEG